MAEPTSIELVNHYSYESHFQNHLISYVLISFMKNIEVFIYILINMY